MDSLDLLEYGIVEADVAPLSLTFPPWFSCSSLGRTSLPLCSGHAAAIQAGIKDDYNFKIFQETCMNILMKMVSTCDAVFFNMTYSRSHFLIAQRPSTDGDNESASSLGCQV